MPVIIEPADRETAEELIAGLQRTGVEEEDVRVHRAHGIGSGPSVFSIVCH